MYPLTDSVLIRLKLFRKLRQKDVSKFRIQLCCALIGMLLVFVIGIDRTESFGGCVTVSVLIHYFTLVAVMWMGAEALLMFQKIVIVFVRITTRYIIAVSIICWGMFAWDITFMFTSMCSLYHSVVPLVPVLIPLLMNRNLVVRIRHNSTEG